MRLGRDIQSPPSPPRGIGEPEAPLVAVETRELCLRYGHVEALRAVTLRVTRGALFVVAGPDGAGKSSLLRVLSTLSLPSSGEVLLEGKSGATADPEMRRRLGYLPQGFTLYEDLTVEENLRFFAELYEIANRGRVEELLEWSGLKEFRKRFAGHLSGGMKQKLSLASLLLHDPSLLLLDEPTTGIDVPTRRDFWDYLLGLRERGMTVVVATPYLEEARQADRVAFLQDGRVVTEMAPAEILRALPGGMWELSCADPAAARDRLRASGRLPLVTWRARRVRLMAPDEAALRGILRDLSLEGTLEAVTPSFEDAFLYMARTGDAA